MSLEERLIELYHSYMDKARESRTSSATARTDEQAYSFGKQADAWTHAATNLRMKFPEVFKD